jgi:hypothetical protein
MSIDYAKGGHLATLWPQALALLSLGLGMLVLSMRRVARAFE